MVHAKLPRAGLANKLLVWANAFLYSHHNKKKLVTTGWLKLHIGPFLRKERSKRLYYKFFNRTSPASRILLFIYKIRFKVVHNPRPDTLPEERTIQIFDKVPHHSDYFVNLRESRILVKEAFGRLIRKEILEELESYPHPIVAAHIRMGDFRKLNHTQDFKNLGATRTPLEYFKNIFIKINEYTNKSVPITIFTDGYENELKELVEIENVKIFSSNIDLIDMLLLSKAKVIITSAGSTFSYWSAFISEASIIHHPDHNEVKVRSKSDGLLYYEGIFCKEAMHHVIKY